MIFVQLLSCVFAALAGYCLLPTIKRTIALHQKQSKVAPSQSEECLYAQGFARFYLRFVLKNARYSGRKIGKFEWEIFKGLCSAAEKELAQLGVNTYQPRQFLRVYEMQSGVVVLTALYIAISVGVIQSFLVALVLFALIPQLLLLACKAECAARKKQLEVELPTFLDIMCLSLQSGLSIDKGIELYLKQFDTLLGKELKAAQNNWKMGFDTKENALRSFAARYQSTWVSQAFESLIRSLRFGVGASTELLQLAASLRKHYSAELEQRIEKAPVKMMLPTGVFILPALLIFILGPILLGITEGI